MENQTITTINAKPNSYEFGKAGSRLKLYFDDAADLDKQIKALQALGYGVEI